MRRSEHQRRLRVHQPWYLGSRRAREIIDAEKKRSDDAEETKNDLALRLACKFNTSALASPALATR